MTDSARTPPRIELRWPQPGVAHLVVLGEHDLASGRQLEEAVRAVLGATVQLVIDLTGVEFIDTTLINGLCRAKREADLRDVTFNVIIGGNEIAARALEVTSLVDSLHGVESLEAALQPRRSMRQYLPRNGGVRRPPAASR